MFDIIVNPISGKGKGAKALDKITALLDKEGIEYKVHKTQRAAHATQIVKELNDSQDHTNLVILGGDGSFNEVLNGVTDFSKITISFIPCGTGNDFAAAAKISTDPEKAILSAIKGEKRYIDFIQIGERRALNAAGAGLDVDVLEKYSTMKAFKGKMKYYASLLSVLCHVKFHKLRLTVDGVTTEVNPIVGSEAQSEELVKYLLSEFETDPKGIWQTNMFGKSLESLVNEGLNNKLTAVPDEAHLKMRKTLGRIINEGKGGMICILL